MRVLISGASGYLGGRIARYLSIEGFNVFKGMRRKNKFVNSGLGSKIVELAWTNIEKLEENCAGFDIIIHSAGMNAKDCASNPDEAFRFNGDETGNLVRASVKAGIKKFIYLSTVHVYSSPLIGNFSEKNLPENQHPYALSNLMGEEKVIKETSKSRNTQGVIFRLSNAVGSPLDKHVNCWDLVINDLCRQVVEKKKIELVSSPNIKRDFFPISFLEKTIHEFISAKSIKEDTFNLCSSKSKTLRYMADLVRDRAKKTLKIDVDIKYNALSSLEAKDHLHISNSLLQKYVEIEDNLNKEIDVLLSNCRKWFS